MKTKSITKEQIIKAAAIVFAEVGLENANVDQVAKKAGIAKGSIYSFFKTKDEILIEGVKYFVDQRISILKELVNKLSTNYKKLEALMNVNEKMFNENPESYFMNYALLISTHKDIKKQVTNEFFNSYLKLVEDVLKSGIKKREFQIEDPKIMAFILVTSLDLYNIIIFSNKKQSKNITNKILNILNLKNEKRKTM
jgi:AcrR family transcriptional regulator